MVLRDGILYHPGGSGGQLVPDCPSELLPGVMHDVHGQGCNHGGAARTAAALAGLVYHPRLVSLTEEYVRSCEFCQR